MLTQYHSIENVHQELRGQSANVVLFLFSLSFAWLKVAITLKGPPHSRGTSNRNGTAGKHDPHHRTNPISRRSWAGTSNTRGRTGRIHCMVPWRGNGGGRIGSVHRSPVSANSHTSASWYAGEGRTSTACACVSVTDLVRHQRACSNEMWLKTCAGEHKPFDCHRLLCLNKRR